MNCRCRKGAWHPACNGWGKVEKLGLFGFKWVRCKFCGGVGRV